MKFSANDNYSIFNFPLNICFFVWKCSHMYIQLVIKALTHIQIKRFPFYIMFLGNEQNRKKQFCFYICMYTNNCVGLCDGGWGMGDGDDQDKIKFKFKWFSQFAGNVSHHNGPFFQFFCQKDSFIL